MPALPPGYDWEATILTASDFVAGPDDDTQKSAGEVGEFANSEVGSDGRLSAYDAVVIGQYPDADSGDVKGNEPYVDLEAGAADVADTVEYRLGTRRKGDRDGPSITGWRSMRNADTSDPAQRRPLNPGQPFVRDGRLVTFQSKDETANHTVDLSECTFEIPVYVGTKKNP